MHGSVAIHFDGERKEYARGMRSSQYTEKNVPLASRILKRGGGGGLTKLRRKEDL